MMNSTELMRRAALEDLGVAPERVETRRAVAMYDPGGAVVETPGRVEHPAPSGTIIGIDCGKEGYATELGAGGSVLEITHVPTLDAAGSGHGSDYDLPAMAELARSWKGRVAFALLEKQQAFPDQDASTNFVTGMGYGFWKMALTAAGIPFQEVAPITWKRQMGIQAEPIKKTKEERAELAAAKKRAKFDPAAKEIVRLANSARAEQKKHAKARAIAHAQQMFPELDLRRNERCRVADDNKAESVLLAVYARRLHLGR